MFNLYTETPQFFNDICDEVRLFFDVKKITKIISEKSSEIEGYFLLQRFKQRENSWTAEILLYLNSQIVAEETQSIPAPAAESDLEIKKYKKRFIKTSVYKCFKHYTKKELPWGSLTGIRPTKLARELSNPSKPYDAAKNFTETFDVLPEKTNLAFKIVEVQKNIYNSISANDIDIYINIPFCVSRCSYCSFITHDFNRSNNFKSQYLDSLKKEIEQFMPYLEKRNLRSLYIGGGTPTALNDDEFTELLKICVGIGTFKEFCVEAGRPDTINDYKLSLMKTFGANRISINPQTFNQRTLNYIGRKHTVEQFYETYLKAKEYGFPVINTDIILGLPGEDADNMRYSLERALELNPENLTIHTFALKRSSQFAQKNIYNYCNGDIIERIIENAHKKLEERGYFPYYLYRQKYMNGNLENTGFCKDNTMCIYNIDNMEEIANIAAFGAGAISKRIFSGDKRIERQANVKDVELYIKNIDEMINRKRDLFY